MSARGKMEAARNIASTLLSIENGKTTDEVIWSAIHKTIDLLNDEIDHFFDKQELFNQLRADLSIVKGSITELYDPRITPWLNNEKANIHFELWNRYKSYVSNNNQAFPINDLDDFTDKILDKCVNPKVANSWDRRGLVVGHVQSGKTSNYIGLINKATDAGYKVIIVIAGTISSLRRQTQERIDAGYIGRNSSVYINAKKNSIIGVGRTKVNTDIYSFTSSYYKKTDEGDFNQQVANRLNIPIGKNPIVLVIKKNKSILENLITWFSNNETIRLIDGTPKLFDIPTLIIDDEADAASVNTTKEINEVKTINRLIRTLLNVFDQKTFIGYTATPYANLFIPQTYNEELTTIIKGKQYQIGEDLFPRDFIINIKAPSNYIGAAKIFGYEDQNLELTKDPLDIFRVINEFDPPFSSTISKKNKDNLPDFLPESLLHAIKSFFLTCAIRRVRGHENQHNSMLIHVALLVRWIDRIAYIVNEKTKEYQNAIESEDETLLNELKELYETDFVPTTQNVLENLDYIDHSIKVHSWEEIKQVLKQATSKIEVRAVHGTRSTTNLEYHNIEEIDYNRYVDGFSVIAVGGSRLSRGITLEGLSVSYFLRTTSMYDSLMQMGRWFGYRPGYVDLCRLYTTEQIFEWFNHITMATEEMRNDFDEMTATHKRPSDFQLRVRNHHGLLTITNLNKLHFSENLTISFSGQAVQTYYLLKTKDAIQNNFKALQNLINTIGFPTKENRKAVNGKIRHALYPNVNIEALCDFIEEYKIDQPSIHNASLSEYIKLQAQENTIEEWSICIVSNTDERVFIDYQGKTPANKRTPNENVAKYQLKYNNEEMTLSCIVRNQQRVREGEFYWLSKNQIDQAGDRQVDLTKQNKDYTYNEIKKQRKIEKKGLLLIYALDERGTPNLKNGIPIIGYSLHFPQMDNDIKVTYTATIKQGFDQNPMLDDDNPETDNT